MITPEQKTRIKKLVAALVVAEVDKRSTPRFSVHRPTAQADWHKAVENLDRYLDGLMGK